MSVLLYDRPAEGTGYRGNLDGLFDGYRRTSRAVGGYFLGKFVIKTGGMPLLTDFYNTWLGYKIKEIAFGMTNWEGIIWQLDLIKNGVNYRRTFNPNYWHNRIKLLYGDATGERQSVTWVENTDSSDIYGEMEMIIPLGSTTTDGATARRDRELLEYAWPRSRNVGGVDVSREKPPIGSDGLYATMAGFWTTLNWQYRESSEIAGASTLLTTLIGETEFVTAGRIETNSLSVKADADPIPQRIGDLVELIIKAGDSSGNIWKGGVYKNAEFIYESAPTTVDYILKNGALYDKAGVAANLPLVEPGFYVRDANAPTGYLPPGTSNIWDDPQVSYCHEIEYIWPDMLKLRFPGEDTSVDILPEAAPKRGQPKPAYPGIPPYDPNAGYPEWRPW